MREARRLITDMRIPALENRTLAEALKAMTKETLSELPVDLQFELRGRIRQGPYTVEANLFQICREAVTNAVSHASPKRIRVELLYAPDQLRMTIADDGAGFDLAAGMAKESHWVLSTMQERARNRRQMYDR
jgi:two-component system NarL family sensor kinase